MKRIGIRLYICVFALVMGFAAGAATAFDVGYADAALMAMGSMEGTELLTLALYSMLMNTAMLCWCRICGGKAGTLLTAAALWVKGMLEGMFCRELLSGFSGIKAVLLVITLFGGACVCMGMLADYGETTDKGKALAIWLTGAAAESIIISSAARTWALLFTLN